jgi:hypothetical protein
MPASAYPAVLSSLSAFAGRLLAAHGLAVDQLHLPAELLGQVPPDLDRDRLGLEVRGDRPVVDRYRLGVRCHEPSQRPVKRETARVLNDDKRDDQQRQVNR